MDPLCTVDCGRECRGGVGPARVELLVGRTLVLLDPDPSGTLKSKKLYLGVPGVDENKLAALFKGGFELLGTSTPPKVEALPLGDFKSSSGSKVDPGVFGVVGVLADSPW